jgi:hypothetical protein
MQRFRALRLLASGVSLNSDQMPVCFYVPDLREASVSGLDVALCGTDPHYLSLQIPPRIPGPLLDTLSASPQSKFLKIDFDMLCAQRWAIIAGDTIHRPELDEHSLTSKQGHATCHFRPPPAAVSSRRRARRAQDQ